MNSDTPSTNPYAQNQNLSNTKMANQQHNQEKSATTGNSMSSPPPIGSIRRTRTKLSSDSPKPLHPPPHSIHSVSYSAEISSSKDNGIYYLLEKCLLIKIILTIDPKAFILEFYFLPDWWFSLLKYFEITFMHFNIMSS